VTRPPATSQRAERILIVQTSFLGDVVLTTPLIAEVRRRFRGAMLAVLCNPQAAGLLEANPDIDQVILYDKNSIDWGLGGLRRAAAKVRSHGFTLAISPHKSLRTSVLLYLAGIPERVGFRESAGWFLYHRTAKRAAGCHDVERNLSILKALGIEIGECRKELQLPTDPAATDSVARLFSSLGVEKDRMIFGINAGSVWPTKRWHLQGFARLMELLDRKHSCRFLLFGGPQDGDLVAELDRLSGHRAVNLSGKLSLRELASALDWCDVFVSNDSGPMHMAVARGVPVVAIFCATTPALGFYPYTSNAVVVEKELPCRPCGSHGGRRCPLGTEDCIRLIRPEDVLGAVERLLAAGRPALSEDLHRPQFVTI
jgi:heptosyltransferase-2